MQLAASSLNDISVVESWSLEKEDVPSPSSEYIVTLPGELLNHILTFLPGEKDLLAFELVFRGAIQYTGPAWECLAKQERLDIDWSLSDQDKKKNPEKARYLHGRVLVVYSTAKSKRWTQAPDKQWIPPSFQEVQKLFERFEGIMRHYPSSLGAFLWKDLNALHRLNSASHEQLFQRDFSIESSAGDLLLKGLSYLAEHILLNDNEENDQQSELRYNASKSLRQAIQKGVTCASYLAIQILYPKYPDPDWYCSIAKGDYRGFELLLEKFPNSPYEGVAFVKLKLNKFGEAEDYFTKAITAYAGNVPADVYANTGFAKYELNKLGEAEDYYTKAITAYGNNVPANVHANAATVKFKLNKLEEAEDYFIKAIAAYGNNVPANIYPQVAFVKVKLNKLGEAEDYCIKAIAACGDNVPGDEYVNAASVKTLLNKLGEAEDYCIKAIAAYGNDVPAHAYAQAADIKTRLAQWKEAKEYSDKALAAYKDNVPNDVLEQAAMIKEKLTT